MCLLWHSVCDCTQGENTPRVYILAKIENSINLGFVVTATWGLGGSYSAVGNNALENNSRMIKYSA